MALNRTTKIEAINSMLTCLGEAPISSLSSDSIPQDAAIALSIFDEVSREVQSRGWFFNTDTNVELTRNSSNYIPVPATALRLDISREQYGWEDICQRGDFLYNASNSSNSDRYVFDTDVKATIIYVLDFTLLTQPAREYIVARASRILQERVLGSADLSRVLSVREQETLADLMQHESQSGNFNYLDDPDSSYYLNRYI
jgi:hypothetical protein